jgi:hypothetical protein
VFSVAMDMLGRISFGGFPPNPGIGLCRPNLAQTPPVNSGRRAFVNFASFRLPKYRHSADLSLLTLLLAVSTKPVDNPVENLKRQGSISGRSWYFQHLPKI